METKVITKKVHDRLDSFVLNKTNDKPVDIVETQNKKQIKRNDGLIERVDISKKVYITEDNRQLLND